MIFTLVPIIKADAWWIRVFDFPRLQIVGAIALVIAVMLLFFDLNVTNLAFIGALAASLAHQAYMMFPYTRLAKKQVQDARHPRSDDRLRLFFANVLMTNRKTDDLLRQIAECDPDIILAAETDKWWDEQLSVLEKTHPFSVRQPQDNTYGMVLYSRLELVKADVKFLIADDIPSIHARVVLPSGRAVELRCLHPRPPFPTEDDTSTGRDAELLLVGKEIRGKTDPVVVFGDLNDVAWSRTNYLFQDISGLLDPRIGRGFYHTFHAGTPLVRFPLDHFFHSHDFRLIDFRRLSNFGSDHFPVFIDLGYEPDAQLVQEELQAEPEQEAEAVEKIKKAL